MQKDSRSQWPIVGRDNELRQASAALAGGAEFHGVALIGESGVGKSTLARALADRLESGGATVRYVLGTKTGSTVPLGAFYRSVTVDAPQEAAAMLVTAQRTLERETNLVVVVDDAQLLDPLSSTLVHQLAVDRSVRLIVAIRSGEPASDAVTTLLKERLLLSLHIEPFTLEETEVLARAVLGGAIDTRLTNELHGQTAGNPLLLRGLLGAGRDSGVLVRTDAGWQLRGVLGADRQLYDLLDFRLQSFAPEELEAVEILAAAEVLDWEILRELCDADVVARLERRGVIQLVADGPATVARLYHPILGRAAIQHAGVVRSRQLNSLLAQQLQKQLQIQQERSGQPDVRTRIRLALFMARSDLTPDLDVIIRAAASAMTMSNFACGEELARFALDRGGGLPAAIVLARALSWLGRGDETEAVLADVGPSDGADEWLIVQWGGLRALNLFFNCGQVEQAWQVLADVKNRVASEAFAVLVTALEVSFGFFSGDLATAIETGPMLCGPQVLPLAALWAAVATSCALALAGRFGEVDRIAAAGLRAAALSESGSHRFTIGLAQAKALTGAGDFPAAERVWERFAAMAAGMAEANAMVYAMLGVVQLGRGALASACAALQDSISAMSHGFPSGWLMLVSALLAQAEGARGDGVAAAAALRRSEEVYGPQVAVFLPELELARAWERASVGQMMGAQTHAVRAAQLARQSGMCAVEMRARHTAVRFDDRSQAERLAELAKTLNTPLVEAVVEHARGLANHDGDVLDAAADRFAELGAVALAADTAAQAAREHARRAHRGKETKSSARAHWLASQHEIRSPAVHPVAQPLPITDREREIANLVAAGLSNRHIAERLSVSVRTVEGHVYRIFDKLGIEGREQLIHLVSSPRSGM